MRRRLTGAELRHAYESRLAHEQSNFPEHTIDVMVQRETDDAGHPQFHIITKREYFR